MPTSQLWRTISDTLILVAGQATCSVCAWQMRCTVTYQLQHICSFTFSSAPDSYFNSSSLAPDLRIIGMVGESYSFSISSSPPPSHTMRARYSSPGESRLLCLQVKPGPGLPHTSAWATHIYYYLPFINRNSTSLYLRHNTRCRWVPMAAITARSCELLSTFHIHTRTCPLFSHPPCITCRRRMSNVSAVAPPTRPLWPQRHLPCLACPCRV